MRALLLIFAGLTLCLATASAAQVVNPRITTDSSVDCSSAEAVVKQITKPDMTDEQKAVACWRFMLDHFYHWYPPKEADVPTEVRDFAKAINSYGFGPCFVNAPVLTDLWEAAGLETRSWTITGHSIPEVKYGGAWHMLDADARGWHKKADGQIASVEELASDAKLITDPKEKSDPFYPFALPDAVAKPLEPWGPPSKMMDLYLSKRDNYPYNRRAVMGHPMYLTLRQGEKLTLSAANEGKWYKFKDIPESAVQSGPIDVSKTITYGNGYLVYHPDLKKATAAELLWLGSKNVKLADGKLVPEKEGEPAVAVFRVWCPYVLVEAKAKLTATGAGAAPKVEISTDGGAAWAALEAFAANLEAGVYSDTLDLSKQAAGRYEYLLRVTVEKLSIDSLSFDNTFQLAPLALPRLKPGKNKVTVFRGPDEGVVQLVLGNSKEAKERYLVESKGLAEPVKAVVPAKYGEPALVVYKLAAPEALAALSVGANLTMDAGKDQHITASYSLDAGKTWKEIWKLAENTNGQNSQFELDKRAALENPAGAKEALVKFDMLRNSKYFAVAGVRLYGFYKQPQPEGARLDVTIAWQEKAGDKWEEKKQSVTVEKFPHEFELSCGGEAVKLARIEMAPAP